MGGGLIHGGTNTWTYVLRGGPDTWRHWYGEELISAGIRTRMKWYKAEFIRRVIWYIKRADTWRSWYKEVRSWYKEVSDTCIRFKEGSNMYMDELIQRKTWYMNKLTHEESSCMERIYVGRNWSRYSEMIHRGTRMWRDLIHERCWSIRYLIRGRSLYMKELTHVRIWSMDGSHPWRAITHEGSWRMESSVRWSELIRGRS